MYQTPNVTIFAKQLSVRFRKEVMEAKHAAVAATAIIFLCLTSLVFILTVSLNTRVKKCLLSDDLNYFDALSSAVRLSTEVSFSSPPWHGVSDKELMRRASMAGGVERPVNLTPKVAFMFLARGVLPLAPLWEIFFKGHEGFYSIYVHSWPDLPEEQPESSVFYRRSIRSKPVEWGKPTMIDAERRLLGHALLDLSNQRFLLLSETCIPLFNFTFIYTYLTNSSLSFLGSFDDPRPMGRGRYNHRMWPHVSLADWRKGSQWFEVNRRTATVIVSDKAFYEVFSQHCKPPCYADEHYIPTLVTKLCPEWNSNRSVTWVDWSRGGSHPTRFVKKDVSLGFLNGVRFGYNCSYDGRVTNVCFLFARKFHVSALNPLLRLAPCLFG